MCTVCVHRATQCVYSKCMKRVTLQSEIITHGPACVSLANPTGADCTLFTAGYKYIYGAFYSQLQTEGAL